MKVYKHIRNHFVNIVFVQPLLDPLVQHCFCLNVLVVHFVDIVFFSLFGGLTTFLGPNIQEGATKADQAQYSWGPIGWRQPYGQTRAPLGLH